MAAARDPVASRTRILDAAVRVIRTKGYAATTIDDLCAEAGLSKGSFFHHFAGKEQLALAAAEHFSGLAAGLCAHAPYRDLADPLDRLLGYVAFRRAILVGEPSEFTCLFGTLVQETHATHPAIRAACDAGIRAHADDVARDVAAAKALYAPDAAWSAQGLALHTQAVLQGAFVLAKAGHDSAVAAESLSHLERYLTLLFGRNPREE
jgi:TetR/AcrR family transcriptional repressor of nem operon